MPQKKATPKQLKMIWALKKQLGVTTQWHANMNFKTAQDTINVLLQQEGDDVRVQNELRERGLVDGE